MDSNVVKVCCVQPLPAQCVCLIHALLIPLRIAAEWICRTYLLAARKAVAAFAIM